MLFGILNLCYGFVEGYCPSRSAVAKFRAEGVYVDFIKQWNIGVYFRLRY